MMPLAVDANPWSKPASPIIGFDSQTPMFKTGDQLDDSMSSSSGDKGDRPNPSRYKTELCRPFEENGTCKYGDKCQFAHGRAELRNLNRHPKYKTELCRTFHTTGICPYGPRCHFLHAEALDSPAASKHADTFDADVVNNNNNNTNIVNNNLSANNNIVGNNNTRIMPAKNHQSFIPRSNNSSNNNNIPGVYNNFLAASSTSSSSSSSTPSQRPSNLNLSLCLNNGSGASMMIEGEISPPSSVASYSACSPMIPSFPSAVSSSSSSSSSASVWGPSPSPMSPSSTVSFSCSYSSSTSSSSSSSHYSADGGGAMDRPMTPASAASPTTPFVIGAPFTAPPPPAAPFEFRPIGCEIGSRSSGGGEGGSPPPGLYRQQQSQQQQPQQQQPEPGARKGSVLNPSAEAWRGVARTDGGGLWNDSPINVKSPLAQQQQEQQQQQQSLLTSLGNSANFDQLSKMIVNELLERLKGMIADQMGPAAPPQIQQQALLEQIQALLNGGGSSAGGGPGGAAVPFGGNGGDAAVLKSLRGMHDRWSGGGGSGGLVDPSAKFHSLFSKRGGGGDFTLNRAIIDEDEGYFVSDHHRPSGGALSAAAPTISDAFVVRADAHVSSSSHSQGVVATDIDDGQETPVRLPIFSQLTK